VLDVVQSTRWVPQPPRLIADAAILGTCLVLLAAMVARPALDRPLTVALAAFGVAMPLVVLGHIAGTMKAERARGQVPVGALSLAALGLEAIGYLAALVGLIAVFGHLSLGVALIFVGTTLLGVPLLVLLTGVIARHSGPAQEAGVAGGTAKPASDEAEGQQGQAPSNPQ
jgi:hypothetical protein